MIDSRAEADLQFDNFEAAIQRDDWSAALDALHQAIDLDPTRCPFPADQYELAQILAANELEVDLLCRHRSSNAHLVFKAPRAAELPEEEYLGAEGADEDISEFDQSEQDLGAEKETGDDLEEEPEYDPELAAFYCARGKDQKQNGELAQAFTDFTEAIRLDPDLADAYNSRANLYFAARQYDEAIADYSEAIRIVPGLAVAHLNRGLAHARKEEFAEAITDATAALRLDPSLPGAYYLRGTSRYRRDEYAGAVADLTEAIRLNSVDVAIFNQRGMAYAKLGDYDRAIDDYEHALKLWPEMVPAHFNRATAYQVKGDPIRAVAAFSEVIQLEPENAEAFYQRGLAYMTEGDFDAAIADFSESYRLDPSNALAVFKRDEAARAKKERAKQPRTRVSGALPALKTISNDQSELVCSKCGKKWNPGSGPGQARCPQCKTQVQAGQRAAGEAHGAHAMRRSKAAEKGEAAARPRKITAGRRRWYEHWAILGSSIAACLLLAGGGWLWFGGRTPTAQLTAYDLWWECTNESLAAAHKYDGKLIQVVGVVDEIEPGDRARVVFREPLAAPPTVECFIDPRNAGSEIQVNQWLTVVGKCQCAGAPEQPIQLLRCRVVEAP